MVSHAGRRGLVLRGGRLVKPRRRPGWSVLPRKKVDGPHGASSDVQPDSQRRTAAKSEGIETRQQDGTAAFRRCPAGKAPYAAMSQLGVHSAGTLRPGDPHAPTEKCGLRSRSPWRAGQPERRLEKDYGMARPARPLRGLLPPVLLGWAWTDGAHDVLGEPCLPML